jgi:glycosyltransferase involved in cell wall biosynthesis
VVRHSRWVSVATEPIAAWARQHSSNVTVVPMALDLSQYVPRPELRTLTLGWAGTAGGLRYLEQLAPVLRDLAVPVKVVSGGYRDVTLPGVQLQAEPWRGIHQLSDMSIGLLPLDDTEFERAKFPFKLLQYMALNMPVVASHVGLAAEVIVDGENGFLAWSHDEWVSKLQRLVRDAATRQRLGANGRKTVEQQYTIERVGPLLAAGLLDAAR